MSNIEFPLVYVVKNLKNEILLKASSGGVFFELARLILQQHGVIYGAAFTADFRVVHTKAESIDELYKLMSSKYIQSDMGNCFKEISELLLVGKTVLFSGTPCQVGGLNKFLQLITKKFDGRLITVDLICHGVPSPEVFRWHKEKLEHSYKGYMTSYSFRCKDRGRTQAIKAGFLDGKEYYANTTQDRFYKLFLYDYILRPSCYRCKYTTMQREADITLGDFWGYQGDLDSKRGLSLVLINTGIGQEHFESCKEQFEIEPTEAQCCLQQPLQHPAKMPSLRRVMFFLWRHNCTFCIDLILNFKRVVMHFKG